jgi:hypothetical protein
VRRKFFGRAFEDEDADEDEYEDEDGAPALPVLVLVFVLVLVLHSTLTHPAFASYRESARREIIASIPSRHASR